MPNLDRLQIFYGDCSPALAQIYARLPECDQAAGWSLGGTVRGPHCALARTLPATVSLADAGPGGDMLARAVVPDPVFWSPDMPALYDVVVELRRDGETIESVPRQLGIRALGVRKSSLYLEGKRWVLRGADRRHAAGDSIDVWRDEAAAMVVSAPDEELLRNASRQGVVLVAELPADAAAAADELRRLSRWAAVVVAVADAAVGESLKRIAPNILLAQRIAAGEETAPQAWAQLAIVEVDDPSTFAERAGHCNVPIVAFRPLPPAASLSDARRGCDHLQRDLAPYGDFAGYLV